jgi:murein DD-endopeptidase MepM/ murein hydrolase activator NlpD
MKLAWALIALASGCATSFEDVQVNSRIRVYTVGSCAELSWPVEAPLSSPFGRRALRQAQGERSQMHEGIDLAVPEGTPVHAACDGVVAYAGAKLRGYGNLIILQHGDLATVYAHNSALLVREGEQVSRGALIARSGATGHVTAPHLHFEVRRGGKATDPLIYLAHGQPSQIARGEDPRRPGLSQAGHSVQGRDAAARSRPVLPPVH